MGVSSSRPSSPGAASLFTFALAAVEKIHEDTIAVCKERGLKAFSGSLRAELFSASETLREFDDTSNDKQSNERVLNFLDNLEALCQWPTPFHRARYNLDSDEFDPDWYPSLQDLLTSDNSVQESIRAIARGIAGRDFRGKLLRSLEVYNTSGNDVHELGVYEMSNGKLSTADPVDIQGHLQSLYKTLAEHCLCKCPQNPGFTVTNLRLNSLCNGVQEEGPYVPFNLLFLDHHKPDNSMSVCRWQDTQISVVRDKRLVRFDKCPGKVIPESTREDESPVHHFCTFVTRGAQAQLRFVVSDTGLKYQTTSQSPRAFLTNSESIPLASLISSTQLTAKVKALLSFFIARSVWQFYDSKWMKTGWSKEYIHFMGEHHRPVSGVVFINELFLRARFEEIVPNSPETSQPPHHFTTHVYPKILALGIMLLEIELGRSIQDFVRPDSGVLSDVNALHLAACDVLRDATIWPPEDIFTDVKEVIRICIEPDTERLGIAKHCESKQGQKDVRHGLYQSVVAVLENFFQKAWDHPDKVKINPIEPRTVDLSANKPLHRDTEPSAATSISNHDRVMNQVVTQHVSGGIHYHLARVG